MSSAARLERIEESLQRIRLVNCAASKWESQTEAGGQPVDGKNLIAAWPDQAAEDRSRFRINRMDSAFSLIGFDARRILVKPWQYSRCAGERNPGAEAQPSRPAAKA